MKIIEALSLAISGISANRAAALEPIEALRYE
jgi:ABC-type lipoprotein release transport system permease subunit